MNLRVIGEAGDGKDLLPIATAVANGNMPDGATFKPSVIASYQAGEPAAASRPAPQPRLR